MQIQSISRTTTLADAVLLRRGILVDSALIVGFAFLTAIFAQIAIKFPGTPVPITGQTFAVLCTGAVLGSKRGALSMSVYMLLGMFLMPAFAPAGSFLSEKTVHFILPWSGTGGLLWDLSSGGYIVGFILGAYLVGLLSERGWDRNQAYIICSVAVDLRISNVVDVPNYVVSAILPEEIFDH